MLGGLLLLALLLFPILPRPEDDAADTSDTPRTTITVIGGFLERDRQMWGAIETAFEQAHPDIDLKVITGGGTQRKVDTMIAGGVAPDLMSITSDDAGNYIRAGVLRDLTEFIAADPNLQRDIHGYTDATGRTHEPDYFEFAVNAFEQDGHVYALPTWYMNFFVYYNKALFDKYGVPYPDEDWDWNGFRERAIALTRDRSGRPTRIPLRDEHGRTVADEYGRTIYVDNPQADDVPYDFGAAVAAWQHGVETFVAQNGGSFIVDQGTPNERVDLTHPKTLEAIRFIYDIVILNGCRPSNFLSTGMTDNVRFQDGHVAMLAPYAVFALIDMRDTVRDFEWDVAPLPRGPGGRRASIVFPTGFGITKQSKHPEAAFTFLKWFTGHGGEAVLSRWPLFIPARRSIALSEQYFLDPSTRPDSDWAMVHDVSYPYVDPRTGQPRVGYAELPEVASVRHIDVFDVISQGFGELLRYGSYTMPLFKQFRATHGREPTDAEARALHAEAIDGAVAEIQQNADKAYRWAQRQQAPGEHGSAFMVWLPLVLGALTLLVVLIWRWRHGGPALGPLERQQQVWGYLLISPWIIGFLCLTAGPILFSIGLSLCKWQSLTSIGDAQFIGLGNYTRALTGDDPLFYKSLRVTALYTAFAVPLTVIGGLTLALLLNMKLRGINVWRTFYFVPAVLPVVAVSVLYYYLFNPTQGWVNHLLRMLGWAQPPDWLTSDEPVLGIPAPMWMFILMNLWAVGSAMIIYLGALQGIPTQLYEAAEVDGAGAMRRLRHVTLPMISPVLFFMLIMGIIGSFQVFTSAYVLYESEGGPRNSALFYVLHLFNEAVNRYRFGYGAALAWILFAIILVFTAVVFKSSPMWVYYEGIRERRRAPANDAASRPGGAA